MHPTKQTLITAAIGLLAGVIPAILTHCENQAEIKLKYQRANAVTEAAYEELTRSVNALVDEVERQHDVAIRLEAKIEVLEGRRSPDSVPEAPKPKQPRRLTPWGKGPAMGVGPTEVVADAPDIERPAPFQTLP